MTEEVTVEKYERGVIESFSEGAVLDLRARVALDLLKSSQSIGHLDACEIADDFVAECERRGWIKPLPADGQVDDRTRAHCERLGRVNVISQVSAQRAVAQETGVVQAAGHPAIVTHPGGRA